MGARRFSGRPVPLNLSERLVEVVTAMVAGRAPVPYIAVTWNTRIVYCAARVAGGLTRRGERIAPPRVEFSSKAWVLLTQEEVDTVLVHEAGHVAASLLGHANEHHGRNWRKLMRDYGAPADTCLPAAAAKRILQAYPRKRRVRRVTSQWVTVTDDQLFAGLLNFKRK